MRHASWRLVAGMAAASGLLMFGSAFWIRTSTLNGAVGIKSSATMASEGAWQAAHRAAAWWFVLVGWVFLATAGWALARRPEVGRGGRAFREIAALCLILVAVFGTAHAELVARRFG